MRRKFSLRVLEQQQQQQQLMEESKGNQGSSF